MRFTDFYRVCSLLFLYRFSLNIRVSIMLLSTTVQQSFLLTSVLQHRTVEIMCLMNTWNCYLRFRNQHRQKPMYAAQYLPKVGLFWRAMMLHVAVCHVKHGMLRAQNSETCHLYLSSFLFMLMWVILVAVSRATASLGCWTSRTCCTCKAFGVQLGLDKVYTFRLSVLTFLVARLLPQNMVWHEMLCMNNWSWACNEYQNYHLNQYLK